LSQLVCGYCQYLQVLKLWVVSSIGEVLVITHFWIIPQIHFFSSENKKKKHIWTKNKNKIQKIITVRRECQSALEVG
jgi:hypothetical protein